MNQRAASLRKPGTEVIFLTHSRIPQAYPMQLGYPKTAELGLTVMEGRSLSCEFFVR